MSEIGIIDLVITGLILLLLMDSDGEGRSGHRMMISETPEYDPRIYDSQNINHSDCEGYAMMMAAGEYDKCPDCGGPVGVDRKE